MLTDTAPRKANRAGFLESDRINMLDLPQNGALTEIAQRLQSAMQAERIPDVRKACAEFLAPKSRPMTFQFSIQTSKFFTIGKPQRENRSCHTLLLCLSLYVAPSLPL